MIKTAGTYFAARVLAAICGLLAVAVYTRLATPEVYGVFTLVMGSGFTIFAVCFHWIQSALLRFLPAEDGERPVALGASLAGFAMVTVLLVVAATSVMVLDLVAVSAELMLFAVAMAITYAALEISLAVVHARQRPTTYALMLAARAAGSVVLGSLFLLAGYGAPGLLFGVLIAHAVPALYLTWQWRYRLVRQRFELGAVKRMAAFGLPLGIVGMAAAVIGISDRYLLALLIGVDAAGTYAAPYDLAQRSLQIVMLSAFLAISPTIFRSYELNDHSQFNANLLQQARLILVTALPIATIMAATAPLIGRLLFGAEFRDAAATLIPWIIAATLVQGITSYYYSYCFTLAKRTITNAVIVSAAAALNIVLNLLLIPLYGALGAAFATFASFAFVLAITLVATRFWLPLPWPTVDMLKIAGVCLVSAPFLGFAARIEDLLLALLSCGAATSLLGALLLAIDAAGSRTLAGDLVTDLKRRMNGRWVTQP